MVDAIQCDLANLASRLPGVNNGYTSVAFGTEWPVSSSKAFLALNRGIRDKHGGVPISHTLCLGNPNHHRDKQDSL